MAETTMVQSSEKEAAGAPVALLLIGPGAVGKASVAKALCNILNEKSAESTCAGEGESEDFSLHQGQDMRGQWLFTHNHQAIDLACSMLPEGIPLPWTFIEAIRTATRAFAASQGASIAITNVASHRSPIDRAYISQIAEEMKDEGYRVCLACLCAPIETRIVRDRGTERLAMKPSKKDAAASRELLENEMEKYPGLDDIPSVSELAEAFELAEDDVCVINTVGGTVEGEAEKIIRRLGLCTAC